MKIGQSPEPSPGVPPPTAKRPGAETDAAGQAKGAAQQPPTQASSVSVSTATRTMELSRRSSDTADVDRVKVEQIRAAIEDGSYEVDAQAIADKMLSEAADMLKPRTGNA